MWCCKAPPDLDDVQFNAWIDLAQFHGEIQLLHHVTGDTSGAFSVHTDGPAQLLEIGSNDRVLATGTAALPARVALAVSASGGHFKGMVDGRTVVHGHSTAPPPGRVGLRVIGQGAVAIKEAEIIPLRSP